MENYTYDPEHGAIVNLADNPRGLSYSIRVHELLHVLMWCEGLGEEDANWHKDPVWTLVPEDELPEESPWRRSQPSTSSAQGCGRPPMRCDC